MKDYLLIAFMLIQAPDRAPVVEYERGKVSPVSRGVANRPMQTHAETSKALTREQWTEIRIAQLEAEVLQLQARLATERLADTIRDAKVALKVPDSWLFSVESMKFEAPKEKP